MSLMQRVRVFAIVLTVAAVLAACEVQVGNFGASIGDDPDYSISLYQGQDSFGGDTVTLREVREKGPLVLYYFDADCAPCLAGMRVLQDFYAANEGHPTVLAIFVGHLTRKGNDDDARGILEETAAVFPAGFTTEEFVLKEYELELMPTTSFYNNTGHYRTRISGGLSESDLRENVQEILR